MEALATETLMAIGGVCLSCSSQSEGNWNNGPLISVVLGLENLRNCTTQYISIVALASLWLSKTDGLLRPRVYGLRLKARVVRNFMLLLLGK